MAPDLVVEVAAPSQYRPEMAAKARMWLRAGTRLIWIVWPAQRQVDVWRAGAVEAVASLSQRDTLDGLDVAPECALPVARVFV